MSTTSGPQNGRRIAPMPIRSRGHPGQHDHPQNPAKTAHPSIAPAPSQSSPLRSAHRSSSSSHDADIASNSSRLLTPPEGSRSRSMRRFGETPTTSGESSTATTFTFGQLYNVTPLPSPGPEDRRPQQLISPATTPSPSPNSSVLTPEDRSSQPLHTLYVDDKISVDGEDEFPRPVFTPPADSSRTNPVSQSFPLGQYSLRPHRTISSNPSLRSRSISDVSIISDDERSIPYDVRNEEAPEEPFFNPTFQAALGKGIELAKDVADGLEECELTGDSQSDLNRLWNDAKALSHFQSSDTRTIAVLGDSGEGQSAERPGVGDFIANSTQEKAVSSTLC